MTELNLDPQDLADLEAAGDALAADVEGEDERPVRTVLEAWDKVLDSLEVVEAEGINVQLATTVLSRHRLIGVPELPRYFELYYDLARDMRECVRAEIALHPEALKIEGDGEHNRESYLNVLLQWQQVLILNEREWKVTDPDATIKLAVLADVHAFYLGEMGVAQHLGEIGFAWTQKETLEFAEALSDWAGEL